MELRLIYELKLRRKETRKHRWHYETCNKGNSTFSEEVADQSLRHVSAREGNYCVYRLPGKTKDAYSSAQHASSHSCNQQRTEKTQDTIEF